MTPEPKPFLRDPRDWCAVLAVAGLMLAAVAGYAASRLLGSLAFVPIVAAAVILLTYRRRQA